MRYQVLRQCFMNFINDLRVIFIKNKTYSLLIISAIPVKLIDGKFYALDLWCKDLAINARYVKKLGLVCPKTSLIKGGIGEIPSDITVHVIGGAGSYKRLNRIIEKYDVIQVAGGKPFWQGIYDIYALVCAKNNKKVIFSISSNRVKLTLLNASSKSLLKRLKAKFVAKSIFYTQKFMSYYSDGVLLVGSKLRTELDINNSNIHIGLASWIEVNDILEGKNVFERISKLPSILVPKLCVCARLEKMKGVHIAIESIFILKEKFNVIATLAIYGVGAELDNLKKQVANLKLEEQVKFCGYVEYGDVFYNEIRQYELMLLTNLSDEQPRLIFDAISQGVVPLCPKTEQYKSTGLGEDVLFAKGSHEDLARVIYSFTDKKQLLDSMRVLRRLLNESTIDNMHLKRSSWIEGLL